MRTAKCHANLGKCAGCVCVSCRWSPTRSIEDGEVSEENYVMGRIYSNIATTQSQLNYPLYTTEFFLLVGYNNLG